MTRKGKSEDGSIAKNSLGIWNQLTYSGEGTVAIPVNANPIMTNAKIRYKTRARADITVRTPRESYKDIGISTIRKAISQPGAVDASTPNKGGTKSPITTKYEHAIPRHVIIMATSTRAAILEFGIVARASDKYVASALLL